MTRTRAEDWDAIVVGSGMGGMAAAAALSKAGRKVLLLEQYQTLGGLTHSFSIEGFSWDAGIHYLNVFETTDPGAGFGGLERLQAAGHLGIRDPCRTARSVAGRRAA